jgi:hypothetical protein
VVNGGKYPETPQQNIALIKDGIDDIDAVLGVFNNAGVYPLVIPSTGELEKSKGDEEMTVVASETMLKTLRSDRTIEDRHIVLLCSKDGMRYARRADVEAPLQIFSERFVITLPASMPRQTT